MWRETSEGLEAEFKFKNFVEAFAFMTKVASLAEEQQHHPEQLGLVLVPRVLGVLCVA